MDKFSFPETERRYTEEGYLIVPANIARPGLQPYFAKELVKDVADLPPKYKPDDIIIVYRPPEEVFKEEAVNSFRNIAVTNNHPDEFLNSKNHRKYSVGTVLSDVTEDGKHVKGTLKITDYDTINEIHDGKVDVSAGYYSDITFEEGVTEEGEDYQAVQRCIVGNHVAVVVRGRAGSEVKIADSLDDPSTRSEQLASEGVSRSSGTEASEAFGEGRKGKGSDDEDYGSDGVPGDNSLSPFGDSADTKQVTDEPQNKSISREKELALKLEDAMIKIADLEAQNEKLSTKVLTQDKLDSLVEDRMSLIDTCLKLVGDIDYSGKSNVELKKEVLASKMPHVDVSDKSDDYVAAAFDVLGATVKDSVEELEDGDGTVKPDETTGEPKAIDPTKNVHEGENPDEGEADAEADEPDTIETSDVDTVHVLDGAFNTFVSVQDTVAELTPYEKYCKESREAWKKK